MLPICGICPVKNGRTRPKAINTAERARFFVVELFIVFPLFDIVGCGKRGGKFFCAVKTKDRNTLQ